MAMIYELGDAGGRGRGLEEELDTLLEKRHQMIVH